MKFGIFLGREKKKTGQGGTKAGVALRKLIKLILGNNSRPRQKVMKKIKNGAFPLTDGAMAQGKGPQLNKRDGPDHPSTTNEVLG